MKMINMMIGNSKKKVVLANARKGEGILSNICFWGPHVVPISAADGPQLVPISLKIRSPLGPYLKNLGPHSMCEQGWLLSHVVLVYSVKC